MNASFIVLGITIALGSTFLYQSFKKTRGTLVGFWLMALAGFGTVIVGLFPENVAPALHAAGAFLPFVFGNVALVVLGLSLDVPPSLKWFTIVFGGLALAALVPFLAGTYLWFELGGLERLVAYPQTFWLIVFGVYTSMHRYRIIHPKH